MLLLASRPVFLPGRSRWDRAGPAAPARFGAGLTAFLLLDSLPAAQAGWRAGCSRGQQTGVR